MSSVALPAEATEALQNRVLNLHAAVILLMLGLIAVLAVYAFRLGPLVGPGVESSFGLAVALMFVAGAMIAHAIDQTYRVWPEGRGVRPTFPGFITDRGLANGLRILVLVAAAAAIAYVFALALTS